ncbi:MAG: hypothetical protein QXQ14_03170 [Candidatus Aenigmatarchaeota archaeon]
MKISLVYFHPPNEYETLTVETSKPLNAYTKLYNVLRDVLEIKRSMFFDRDIRFDATDNSFFIRCEANKWFGIFNIFLEFIINGSIPKEGKTKVTIKYRARLACEIEEKGVLKELLLLFYYNFFIKKQFEENKKIVKKVVEEIKQKLISILS